MDFKIIKFISFIFNRGVVALLVSITVTSVMAESQQQAQLFQRACAFSGEFEQTALENNSTKPVISTGSLFFDCTLGMIMKTDSIETKTLEINRYKTSTQILTLDSINYLLDEQDNLTSLKGIAESLQAKLIVSVIGGDQTFINTHFDISHTDESTVLLTPITKTYSRGLQSLTLSQSDINENRVSIIITDKRGRKTTMTMIQNLVYDNPSQALSSCQVLYSGTDYCDILSNPSLYQN